MKPYKIIEKLIKSSESLKYLYYAEGTLIYTFLRYKKFPFTKEYLYHIQIRKDTTNVYGWEAYEVLIKDMNGNAKLPSVTISFTPHTTYYEELKPIFNSHNG